MEKLNLSPEELRFILNEINANADTRREGVRLLKELIAQDQERGLPLLELQHSQELSRLQEALAHTNNVNVQILYALNP
jgi:hypothetical protein